jgi:hypothetical protein
MVNMRQPLRFLAWFAAVLFCAISTVVFSYVVTFLAAWIFRFDLLDNYRVGIWLYGSMTVFAAISLGFLTVLGCKIARGDL